MNVIERLDDEFYKRVLAELKDAGGRWKPAKHEHFHDKHIDELKQTLGCTPGQT